MKNFFEIIAGSFQEKAEYKAYRKLLESLPYDYQLITSKNPDFLEVFRKKEKIKKPFGFNGMRRTF